jgi:glycosyltransferase involved in cell wall biosynthesis
MNSPDERVFAQREPRPLDGRRPVILAHGTLLERSGFETLVAGFSHLRKRVPGALLRIVGDGEHGPALMRAVADAGVADAVQFVGRVPLTRIAAEIAAADIGVAPNDVDAFTALIVPTRLLEYVGVGVPAVTVRSPAVERYFDESAVGLYRSGDAADLAAVLQRVIEAGEEAEGRAANATAQLDAISWRRMRERYLGVVDDLLDQVTRR